MEKIKYIAFIMLGTILLCSWSTEDKVEGEENKLFFNTFIDSLDLSSFLKNNEYIEIESDLSLCLSSSFVSIKVIKRNDIINIHLFEVTDFDTINLIYENYVSKEIEDLIIELYNSQNNDYKEYFSTTYNDETIFFRNDKLIIVEKYTIFLTKVFPEHPYVVWEKNKEEIMRERKEKYDESLKRMIIEREESVKPIFDSIFMKMRELIK